MKHKCPSDYVAQGWTQTASARDEAGEPCAVNSDRACAWCLVGSVVAAYHDDGATIEQCFTELRQRLAQRFGVGSDNPDLLTDWNDIEGRTQGEVLELLQECGL